MALRVGIPLFLVAITVDFATKSAAVRWDEHVIFHDVPAQLPRRIIMSLAAIFVAAGFTRVAARRGLGRPWGAWVGVPLLVAGILGNGISSYLWARGVPDFIPSGAWVFNVADFEIFFGIVGGILALIAGFCLTYAREAISRSAAA